MVQQGVDGLWLRVISLREEIQRRCSSVSGVRRPFGELSLRTPKPYPRELAFYQAITWLYAFYIEAGPVTFRFLMERLSIYGLADEGVLPAHYADVRQLRTFLQHNLDLDSVRDAEVQRACERWFLSSCGSSVPDRESEWSACLTNILNASETFLCLLIECVRGIEKDDAVDAIVEQWKARLSRYHPKHEFERVVRIVTHNIGQDSLDPEIIATRYYDRWVDALKSRDEPYIFDKEAAKLIEHTLLSDLDPPIPITGDDIIREFGIPHGPEVGRLLRRAQAIYYSQPTGGGELIALIKQAEGYSSSAG